MEDLSVKTNNNNRYEVLKDAEIQCYPTENKFNKTKHCETKLMRMKSNKYHVDNIEKSLLNKPLKFLVKKITTMTKMN